MSGKITTSQTVGPFPHEAWRWAVDLSAQVESSAPQIVVQGKIVDGDGVAINDAWVEIWMPDSVPVETAQTIPGYRRVPSDDEGAFTLPITLPRPATRGQPVAYVTVFARGLSKHQFTAVFLEDDAGLAQSDLLSQVPVQRRATLIAKRQVEGAYLWNIHMQGAAETVFFDYV